MADKIRYGAGGVPYVEKDKSNVLSEILEENPNVVEDNTAKEDVKIVPKKGKKK